ncbi:MAG: hypothetical protein ACRC2R_21275 [Xenococcaceae cyanobacterium]
MLRAIANSDEKKPNRLLSVDRYMPIDLTERKDGLAGSIDPTTERAKT